LANLAPLSDAEVREMVTRWYKNLDVHAPEYDMLPMLADKGLEMVFPEATLRGWAEFELWFQGVIRIFFDEVHTMKQLDITLNGDKSQADIKLCVLWEASRWKAPSAKSDRLAFDAYQTWVVKRSPDTGKPVITKYVVDKLDPKPGSAPL
jgi:hypothetical protein